MAWADLENVAIHPFSLAQMSRLMIPPGDPQGLFDVGLCHRTALQITAVIFTGSAPLLAGFHLFFQQQQSGRTASSGLALQSVSGTSFDPRRVFNAGRKAGMVLGFWPQVAVKPTCRHAITAPCKHASYRHEELLVGIRLASAVPVAESSGEFWIARILNGLRSF